MIARKPLPGLLVTLEGPEGAGKSTQLARLAEALQAEGYQVLTSREPGGTPRAEQIRGVLLGGADEEMGARCELLLMLAARADHTDHVLRPALAEGKVVLCDRYVDSSVAYQGAGRGLGVETVRKFNRFATDGVKPDLTLVFDLDPAEGLARATGGKAGDRIEAAGASFHARVRDGFLHLAEDEPDRVEVVDASGDPDAVFEQAWQRLRDRLSGDPKAPRARRPGGPKSAASKGDGPKITSSKDSGPKITASKGGGPKITASKGGGPKITASKGGGPKITASRADEAPEDDPSVTRSDRSTIRRTKGEGYVPQALRIGSDESGKGDYFGPLVVAAAFLDARSEPALVELGVADSKKLSDRQNRQLAKKIEAICPVEVISIGPTRYNQLYAKMKNLNKLLAWAHGKAIKGLLESYPKCEQVVSDKFGPDMRLEHELRTVGGEVEIVQVTRGERDVAVAAASIVARARFLDALDRLGRECGVSLPKGATHVVGPARQVYGAGGIDALEGVAKLHFKTTKKVTAGS